MLILTRREDECVVIGEGPEQVVLTVVDIRGDKVRLGFEAPRQVPIHRKEIADRIADRTPVPPVA